MTVCRTKTGTGTCIFGMRVEPPTRTTSVTRPLSILESHNTFSTGPMHLRKRSLFSSSKRARVRGAKKSTPSNRESISIAVWVVLHANTMPKCIHQLLAHV
jgi:hypothetical protein